VPSRDCSCCVGASGRSALARSRERGGASARTALAVDASVALKWVFPHRDGEAHVGQALTVLEHIRQGRVAVLQPPHWLAEVAVVVSRLEPPRAHDVINLLHAMEFPVSDGVEVYQRACELAVVLRQPSSTPSITPWRSRDRMAYS
jgi:hypothetical protein